MISKTISSIFNRFVTWLFDFLGLWNIGWLEGWYYDWFYGQPEYDEKDIDHSWLCSCGHFEESDLHCTHCGNEPPWGCDCSFCDDRASESYGDDPIYDPGYFEFDYEDYEDDFDDGEPDFTLDDLEWDESYPELPE